MLVLMGVPILQGTLYTKIYINIFKPIIRLTSLPLKLIGAVRIQNQEKSDRVESPHWSNFPCCFWNVHHCSPWTLKWRWNLNKFESMFWSDSEKPQTRYEPNQRGGRYRIFWTTKIRKRSTGWPREYPKKKDLHDNGESTVWRSFFPLKMGIFQCHVSFQGCKSISFEIVVKATLTESNRPLAKQLVAH